MGCGGRGYEILIWKGSCTISLVLGPSANAEIREVPELNVKEIYLLILKHLLEGQG